MTIKSLIQGAFLGAFIIMGATISAPATAQAQDIAPQACDSQFYQQLQSRAWLEAEREIMQNQNLIFKPDSVLEYTCFDQFLAINAWPGGDIFVHTTYFGPMIINRGTGESMEQALSKVVYQSLLPYRGTSGGDNFGHEYLGGRAGAMEAETKNSEFKSPTDKGNASYNCQTMAKIWKTAKCSNFIDNSEFEGTDGFYPFEAIKKHKNGQDVAGYDTIKETRLYPEGLRCDGNDQGAAGTWQDQIKLAENQDNNLYLFQEPLGKVYKDVGERLKPGECGEAIKTGITVIKSNDNSGEEDGVCTNPGCTYSGGNCQ